MLSQVVPKVDPQEARSMLVIFPALTITERLRNRIQFHKAGIDMEMDRRYLDTDQTITGCTNEFLRKLFVRGLLGLIK
jgi:hypothetical protein|tara:strand:+ start:73 stop:306 length:234 start_codon:yes stop_codon:yes gene_type:complete